MASDEELARRVARLESSRASDTDRSTTREELDEYRTVAGEIHDELARRVEAVDDRKPDEEALEALRERVERLESRIDALEGRI